MTSREALTEAINAILSAHKTARWDLEDATNALRAAVAGDPLDADAIRAAMTQYRAAVDAVGFKTQWVFDECQRLAKTREQT